MFKKAILLAHMASASLLGFCDMARAQDVIPPKQYTMTPGGVNLSDGSFIFSETDLTIGNLSLTRHHLSGLKDPNTPPFGPRMNHNFDIYVAPNIRTQCDPQSCAIYQVSKRPIVHIGSSASGTYYEAMPPNVIIQYQNDDSLSGDLEYVSGAYRYTDQGGNIYNFSSTVTVGGVNEGRKVSNILFTDGRRQDFLYNSSNKLKVVIDSTGYAIVFDYFGNGNISTACGFNTASVYISGNSTCSGAQLKASYGYSTDSAPILTSVTDVLGGITTYSYNTANDPTRRDITCIKPPGFTNCQVQNTYGSSLYAWQVTQQTMADGAVWNFSYFGDYSKARDPEMFADVEPATAVTVTDPANKVSYYWFVQSSPYAARDALNRTTTYTFAGGADYSTPGGYSTRFGSFLLEARMPEGNTYKAWLGPRRVVGKQAMIAKPGSGLSDIVSDVGFPPSCTSPYTRQNCTKPVWKKDPKGNQTDFTYTSWGGTLSEMQPAPSAGAARPLKLFTYIQKYAYVKNASGSLVPAAAAIWLLSTETLCQTAAGSNAPTCDSGAPIMVTTNQYGADGTANNLLLKGIVVSSGGTSLRTCYGYDTLGNRISETKPNAGLGSCS